ncbi:MAG: GIY-YIG nuclease family protein [Gammaproteobacteria bacterium]|nr:GIY-YIG nuclease family protein [Gammaproteobacteria bacterium]
MSKKSNVAGVPLIPTIASEHILELYGGRTQPVRTREMRTEVLELHISRDGIEPTRAISSVIEEALSYLKKRGHAEKRSHGLWVFDREEILKSDNDTREALRGESSTDNGERASPSKTAVSGIYGFYYPESKQLADLNGQRNWLIKVGKSSDAYNRISSQTSAMHQIPEYFVIKATDDISQWESTIHSVLSLAGRRSDESPGNEWFLTNPSELEKIVSVIETLI